MFPSLHPLPHAFPKFLPFFITNSQTVLAFADFLALGEADLALGEADFFALGEADLALGEADLALGEADLALGEADLVLGGKYGSLY
jgi:hypothetical protein